MDTKKALSEVAKMLVVLQKYSAEQIRKNSANEKNYNYYYNINSNVKFLFDAISSEVGTIDEQEVNILLQALNYTVYKAERE